MALEIGGYFGFEMMPGHQWYQDLLALNTARNALALLLQKLCPPGLLLPVYNCPDVYEFVRKNYPNLPLMLYHVDEDLEIIDLDRLVSSGWLLYFTNLFGLKSQYVQTLPQNTVVDNAHAFFSLPKPGHHTIYSVRKFFGVSDGAYLATAHPLVDDLEVHSGWENATHLLKRLDCGAKAGYADFLKNEELLSSAPVKRISNISRAILSNINYSHVATVRRNNFLLLHKHLAASNILAHLIDESLLCYDFTPFSYPYLMPQGYACRQFLITHGIFIPLLWSRIEDNRPTGTEAFMANNIIHLPIDQRYNHDSMQKILSLINKFSFLSD